MLENWTLDEIVLIAILPFNTFVPIESNCKYNTCNWSIAAANKCEERRIIWAIWKLSRFSQND